MKVSYDDLPKKFEEIKNQLSKSTQDAVEATLPIWDFYNDEDFKPTITSCIELVNKELDAIEKNDSATKPKKSQKAKEPKAKESKAKKEFSGEYVEILCPEISFTKRYNSLHGKTVSNVKETARKILAGLQKAIIEKKIRKTSPYAELVMKMQRNLIKVLNASGSTVINIENHDELKSLCSGFAVIPNARLIKSYIAIQGKTGVKEKAQELLKKFNKSTDKHFESEFNAIKKSLLDYVDGKTETPEISAQTLAGLYGVAGLTMEGCKSGSAVGSTEFLAKKFKILSFSGKFGNLIGQPSEPFKIMIYGKAGSGKSSLSLQLAQYLAELGKKVLYVADEERFGYTLQEKMRRFNIHHRNLFVVDAMPKKFDGYDVVFIDSVNSAGYEPEDLRKLDTSKSYVYVFQCTKEGNFRGSQEFEHDVDTSIVVEDMKAHAVKNRFGGNGEISVR